eukprot:gene6140-7649_t
MSKVCAVIGVGPGIGFAVAKKFSKEGFTVALVSRSKDKLEPYLKEIQADNGKAISIAMDATNPQSVQDGFDEIRSKIGVPSVLVYNAGAFKYSTADKLTPQEFENCWKSNCFGGFLSSAQVIPTMVEKGNGTIIFTGATASLRGGANFSALAVGKFGLRALAQSLARENQAKGIHVSHVIIDGQVDLQKDYSTRPKESFLDPDQVAETYWNLYKQDKTTWTHELELRPYLEKF